MKTREQGLSFSARFEKYFTDQFCHFAAVCFLPQICFCIIENLLINVIISFLFRVMLTRFEEKVGNVNVTDLHLHMVWFGDHFSLYGPHILAQPL